MTAPLPEGWIECEDAATQQFYYCNTATQATTWEHPLDQYFKNLLFVERKNYKERSKRGGQTGAGGTNAVHSTAGHGSAVPQAAELYFKAQLEHKEQQIQS